MASLPGFMPQPKDTDTFNQPIATDNDGGDDVRSMTEVPNIRQTDNYSCGACAAMSVGKYFGVGPATLKEWKVLLGTNVAKSTDPESILKVLTKLGCQCVAKQDMTEDDLCYHVKNGAPVICPIQEWGDPRVKSSSAYGHYVVVICVDYGYVFVQDSSVDNVMDKEGADNAGGRMMIKCDKWNQVWYDEDIGNKPYNRFGIAVYPPKE